MTVQSTADQLADEILRRRQEYADLHIEPHLRGAMMIPKLVVEMLGLPQDRFDEVGRIYDEQFHQAVATTIARALDS